MKISTFQLVVLVFLGWFALTGKMSIEVRDKVECYTIKINECEAIVCGAHVNVDTAYAKIVKLK